MGVGVQGDAVWSQRSDLGQRPIKGLGRLLRQPIDQINIDRFEVALARRFNQREHLFSWLDPVHRLLHRRVEVLHPKAEAVETQLGQGVKSAWVNRARVDFNGLFSAGRERKTATQHAHQLTQLRVIQKSG